MRIAIVDDDAKDAGQLRGVVEAYAMVREMPVEIDVFSSGENFLRVFEPKKYGLVFFDNYIGTGLGIDFARKARALDEEAAFVFVSMSPEFAVSGFEVRALHYLIKPATFEAIAEVFERLWRHTPKPEDPMIEVLIERQPTLIPIRSIRYIEVTAKNCCIHGETDFTIYLPLEKLLELLPPEEFIRTHRSFVVHLTYIQSMDQNSFVLRDDGIIPIGRTYLKECKSAYIEFLANHRP